MVFATAIAEASPARGRLGRSERNVLVLATLAWALGAAAWIADANQTAPLASLPDSKDTLSFEERFNPASIAESRANQPPLQPLDRSALATLQIKLLDAKSLLAAQLLLARSALVEEARSSVEEAKSSAPDVPLPRSRPTAADSTAQVMSQSAPAQPDNAAQPENRTLMQKLSDLLPGRVRLASLTPDIGLFHRGPDLASLGYDNLTAVYDISAHAVYLPDGSSFEAHSGMGRVRDDPDHVSERMVGATPPATYELKQREQIFHGVRALRMTPVDGSSTLGRAGLLVHSYMLGPNGDSNGCVSIKDYDRFLKAFDDGKINRLVVVPSLSGVTSAAQRTTSPS